MQRIAAHILEYEGVEYPRHVIELDDDGNTHIYPFVEEIHSTRFISGRVRVGITRTPEGKLALLAEKIG